MVIETIGLTKPDESALGVHYKKTSTILELI